LLHEVIWECTLFQWAGGVNTFGFFGCGVVEVERARFLGGIGVEMGELRDFVTGEDRGSLDARGIGRIWRLTWIVMSNRLELLVDHSNAAYSVPLDSAFKETSGFISAFLERGPERSVNLVNSTVKLSRLEDDDGQVRRSNETNCLAIRPARIYTF
jgi:hypothetical protein